MPVRVSIRAPDHFGDGVMALPAIAAMAAGASACGDVVRVHAPAWGGDLYGWIVGVEVVPREHAPQAGTVGVLLKPSFGAAWRWRGLPQRVGLAENGRGWLLTRALPVTTGEHRRAGYARVAAACGATIAADARPRFGPRAPWGGPPVAPGFVALNAWGRTPATRWPHLTALADLLVADGHRVVFLAGPGEHDPVRTIAGPRTVLDHDALAPLATLLDAAALVVSHDSGLAHFADACGARVLMLHGPTDPRVTGAGCPVVASMSYAARGATTVSVRRSGGGVAEGGGPPSAPSFGRLASNAESWSLRLAFRRGRSPRMADLSLAQVHAAVQAALAPTV